MGLAVEITKPNEDTLRLALTFDGGTHEREELHFDAKARSWSVTGRIDAAPGKFTTYHMHDIDNPSDDVQGLMFGGVAQNYTSGKADGAPIKMREIFYLASDEWYHWRQTLNGGAWVAAGRRACGRDAVPSI
jgi:hypothetical protein